MPEPTPTIKNGSELSLDELAQEAGGHLDFDIFDQILEMDEDDNREFSKNLVTDFFDQAQSSFKKIETNIAERDLEKLKELGHFLKGSSAALGLARVRDSCEAIQNYGSKKNADGTGSVMDEKLCLQRINETLKTMRGDYVYVGRLLKKFYRINPEEHPDP